MRDPTYEEYVAALWDDFVRVYGVQAYVLYRYGVGRTPRLGRQDGEEAR